MSLDSAIKFVSEKIDQEKSVNKKAARLYALSLILSSKASSDKKLSQQQRVKTLQLAQEMAREAGKLFEKDCPVGMMGPMMPGGPIPLPFCVPREISEESPPPKTQEEKERVQQQAPANRQPWDRLPKTSLRESNPFFLPYPRNEYDPVTETWNPVPNPKNAITFNDLAGLEKVKQQLRSSIVDPFLYPSTISKEAKQKNFIFTGVPGTGKTTIMRATTMEIKDDQTGQLLWRTDEEVLALDDNPYIGDEKDDQGNITNAGFRRTFYPDPKKVPKVILFNIENQDIQSALVVESERKISRFFQMAQQTAPCILFFDEAEAYLNPEIKVNAGNISTMKTETEGFDTQSRDIITVYASNFPTRIDSTVLSRFITTEIGLPDRTARAKLVKTSIEKKYKIPVETTDLLRFSSLLALLSTPPSSKATDIPNVGNQYEAGRQAYVNAYPNLSQEERDIISETAGKSKIYSGRDLDNLIKSINVTLSQKGPQGRVRRCSPDEAAKICTDYSTFKTERQWGNNPLWVPDPNGLPVSEVPADERVFVVPALLTMSELINGFKEFSPTVNPSDVYEQMLFNQQIGDVCDDTFSVWWQNRLSTVLGKKTNGCNATIPKS